MAEIKERTYVVHGSRKQWQCSANHEVARTVLVSCPDPLQRVWCSEQQFWSHGAWPVLDLRSQIAVYFHDVSDRISNRTGSSENLSHSLFSAVPVDLVAISSFCKRGCAVVHMHRGVRNLNTGF